MPEQEVEESRLRRRGNGMLLIAFILVLVLLTLIFNGLLQWRDNPNRLSVLSAQTDELVLRKNALGHYFAEGLINDKPVKFLVDTGATTIALPKHTADSLGLTGTEFVRLNTAAGETVALRTTIDKLQIGPLLFRDLSGVIIAEQEGDTVLLGMNALRQLHMTQSDGYLILRPPIE